MPKYVRLKDELLGQIRSGEIPPGSRLPTRERLVQKHGVTRTTVNRAVDLLKQSCVLDSAPRRGTFVTRAQPALRAAVVFPLKTVPSGRAAGATDFLSFFNSLLSSAGENIRLTFVPAASLEKETEQINGSDAVLWVHPSDRLMDAMQPYRDKSVIVNRYPSEISCVSTDHRGANRAVTDHFIRAAGKRARYYYLMSGRSDFVSRERMRGFLDACETYGQFYRQVALKKDFRENVRMLARISRQSDAPIVFVSGTCLLTGSVIAAMKETGRVYGKDYFSSDFDNRFSVENHGIQVTTLLQDYEEMGLRAASVLRKIGRKTVREFVPHTIRGLVP